MSNNCSVRSWLDGVEHAIAPASTSDSSLAIGQEPENVDSCSIASSASSAPSRAHRSVKALADFRTAEWPTCIRNLDGNEAEAAGGVLSRYTRLMEISQGIRVIPHHLKGFAEKELHIADRPLDSAYTSPEDRLDEVEQTYQQNWGQRANRILIKAAECRRDSLTVANWNARVYDPLLALIVEAPRFQETIGYMNVTDAHIQPSFSPIHLSETVMQSKMVDYAIYLQSSPLIEHIRGVLQELPEHSQSLNQTMHGALRYRPIAINLDTEAPFIGGAADVRNAIWSGAGLLRVIGGAADVRNAIWSGAGLLRLRQLLQRNGRQNERIPTMPVLTFRGYELSLSGIQEMDDHNRFYSQLRVGSMRTLLGVFQILAALDLLIDWVNNNFRNWYKSTILTPS